MLEAGKTTGSIFFQVGKADGPCAEEDQGIEHIGDGDAFQEKGFGANGHTGEIGVKQDADD